MILCWVSPFFVFFLFVCIFCFRRQFTLLLSGHFWVYFWLYLFLRTHYYSKKTISRNKWNLAFLHCLTAAGKLFCLIYKLIRKFFRCDTVPVKYVYSRNFVFIDNFPMITFRFSIYVFFDLQWGDYWCCWIWIRWRVFYISTNVINKNIGFRFADSSFMARFLFKFSIWRFFILLIKPWNEWKKRFQMLLSFGNTPTKPDCQINKILPKNWLPTDIFVDRTRFSLLHLKGFLELSLFVRFSLTVLTSALLDISCSFFISNRWVDSRPLL